MNWWMKLLVKFFPIDRVANPHKERLKGWKTFLIAVGGTFTAGSFIIQQVTSWATAVPSIPFPIEEVIASILGAGVLWSNYTASLPAREAVQAATEAKQAVEQVSRKVETVKRDVAEVQEGVTEAAVVAAEVTERAEAAVEKAEEAVEAAAKKVTPIKNKPAGSGKF